MLSKWIYGCQSVAEGVTFHSWQPPTNDIRIRPKFGVLLFKMYFTDHNEMSHTPRHRVIWFRNTLTNWLISPIYRNSVIKHNVTLPWGHTQFSVVIHTLLVCFRKHSFKAVSHEDDSIPIPASKAHILNIYCKPRYQIPWGQHGAHLGPVGPRWAPCWPHGPCYQGWRLDSVFFNPRQKVCWLSLKFWYRIWYTQMR